MPLTTGKIKPVFLSGVIYFNVDFKEDDAGEETGEFMFGSSLQLDRCTLIPNGDNERLKFDIIFGPGYYERYFTAFLYPDETILGKIKYIQDAGAADQIIKGAYVKTGENGIIIRGIIDDATGAKETFYIELEEAAIQPVS